MAVFFRTIIVFTTVLIILRLMGKRQIGEMQPYELVITLIIADLACIPMSDVSIPLLYGVVAILAVFLIHTIIVLLSRKSLFLIKAFSGKPVIVITPDGIDYDELNSLNMTISDLEENLRNNGQFSFSEIQYAIIETNGKLSVCAKTPKDPNPTIPVTLISAGKINTEGVKIIKKDERFVYSLLKQEKLKNIKSVLIMTIDNDGELYYQEKYKKANTKTIDFDGGDNW